MLKDTEIYTSKDELTRELQLLNGTQAKWLLRDIKQIQNEYSNVILTRYLDTLSEHIVYCLGINVLNCVDD